jgi:hypothetical protein
VNKETLAPFDATVYKGSLRPGHHPDVPDDVDANAFTNHVATIRQSPKGA